MTKFQEGDMVRVKKAGLQTYNQVGVVESVTRYQASVKLFNRDTALTYNCRSLELVDEDSIEYNKGERFIMGNYTVCTIKFLEGTNTEREYHYALYDDNICCGDYVVVKSANHGLGIAKVVDIVPDGCVTQAMRDYCNAGREVIAAFDMGAYNDRVEKRKLAKQLKAEMNKKMKEMQELAMFEMMAEKNPELAEMLAAYKELVK